MALCASESGSAITHKRTYVMGTYLIIGIVEYEITCSPSFSHSFAFQTWDGLSDVAIACRKFLFVQGGCGLQFQG